MEHVIVKWEWAERNKNNLRFNDNSLNLIGPTYAYETAKKSDYIIIKYLTTYNLFFQQFLLFIKPTKGSTTKPISIFSILI